MSGEENLKNKAKNIILGDRSGLIRYLADQLNSHCAYASFYQTAVALDTAGNFRQGEIRRRFSTLKDHGRVAPEKFFTVLLHENEKLGLRVTQVLGNPWFIAKFNILPNEMLPVENDNSTSSNVEVETTTYTHAEFYDGSPLCDRRIEELHYKGWIDYMVIVLEPPLGQPQTISDIKFMVQPITGHVENISLPFIRVLGNTQTE